MMAMRKYLFTVADWENGGITEKTIRQNKQ